MALKVGELFVKLLMDNKEFNDAMNGTEKALSAAEKKAQKAQEMLGKRANALTTAVTLPMAGVGGLALKLAGEAEQAQTAFTTLLGSGEKAKAFMGDLRKFAAETPFEMQGLTKASQKLLAFGFESKQILPMMTSIGNAVSSLGGGAAEIDSVTRALGQMKAKGKVSAEEMNQLAELGINGWELLAKKTGQTQAQLMDQAQKGMLQAGPAIQGILEGMDAKFAGAMDKQSKTFLGQLSNLMDTYSGALTELGNALMPMAKSVLPLLSALASVLRIVGQLPGPIRTMLIALAGAAMMAGPYLKFVAAMNTVRNSVVLASVAARIGSVSFTGLWAAITGPVGLVIAAVALVAGAAYLIWRNWDPIKKFFINLWNSVKKTVTTFFRWLWDMFMRYSLYGLIVRNWGTIVEFVGKLWDRVYDVTIGRLGRVINWVREKLAAVAGFFAELYDKVVGHSYVPDMVGQVQVQFERLPRRAMWDPVKKAVRMVDAEFSSLKFAYTPEAMRKLWLPEGAKLSMSFPEPVRKGKQITASLSPGLGDSTNATAERGMGSSTTEASRIISLLTQQRDLLRQMVPAKVHS